MGWLLHDKTHVWAPAWEGWLALAGLVFFAWPCPSLCHSWHLPASTPPPPLSMPSLAGMLPVYLLWPAACVKGTFWPYSGRGHLLNGGVGGGGARCVCVCVETIQRGWGRWDQQLKELCALHVRGNVWLVYLSVWPPCLVKGKYAPL